MEDRLIGRERIDRDKAKEYCTAFFAANEDHIFTPFVVSAYKGDLRRHPAHYETRLRYVASTYKREIETLEAEEKAISGQAPPRTDVPEASVDDTTANSFLSEILIETQR